MRQFLLATRSQARYLHGKKTTRCIGVIVNRPYTTLSGENLAGEYKNKRKIIPQSLQVMQQQQQYMTPLKIQKSLQFQQYPQSYISSPSFSSTSFMSFSTEAAIPTSEQQKVLGDLTTKSKKKTKKRKKKQPSIEIPTKGINNREIFTSSSILPKISVKLTTKNAKQILNQFTQQSHTKMKQSTDTKVIGPNHKPTFLTTVTTTFDENITIPQDVSMPKDTVTMENDGTTFINTGAASNKKDALSYAILDLLVQLETECNVNLANPSSTQKKARKIQYNAANREILTRSKIENDTTEIYKKLKLNTRNVRQKMHLLQNKLLFQQRLSHEAIDSRDKKKLHESGTNFVSTLTTTFDSDVLGRIPDDAIIVQKEPTTSENDVSFGIGGINNDDDNTKSVQLINSGAASTKKDAMALAAIDFLTQLSTECHVNLSKPPDIKQRRKLEEEEKLSNGIRDAQMILELLGARRPRFTTSQVGSSKGGGGQFVTEMSAILEGGKKLDIVGPPATSKAKAQGLATITAVVGGQLDELFGTEHLNACVKLIESTPADHVSRLTVSPLPEEAWFVLEEALGSREDHEERMRMVEEMQNELEERQRVRLLGEASWHGGGKDGNNVENDESLLEQNKEKQQQQEEQISDRIRKRNMHLQERMEREEYFRTQKATSDPDSKQGQINAIRDALPITKIKDDFLQSLETNQVVVVSGGTGSGKSTQCPQYILEDCILKGKGPDTKILVTQPRRIAASSVAERVASERGENLGNSVGYTVRLKSVPPRKSGSIEFVTTGVLLRRLMRDKTLKHISHVVIDEVHERDINTDFLLVLLRDLLKERPELRVVLMSATLNAESFCNYFGNDDGRSHENNEKTTTPLVGVPTEPRHPIEIVHLEDIAGEGTMMDEDLEYAELIPEGLETLAQELLQARDLQLQLDLEEAEAEEQAALQLEEMSKEEDIGRILTGESSSDVDSDDDDENVRNVNDQEEMAQTQRPTSPRRARAAARVRALRRAMEMRPNARMLPEDKPPSVSKKVREREVNDITVALMAKTAQSVAQMEINAGRKGSVLCFLPGWDEIKETMEILEGCNPELYKKLDILPLHSTIPREDQQRVFLPAADGRVKVILATNIAESSVTINDVLAVIDSGLVREMNWDAESSMSTMCTVPTSQASTTQRTGRAGRVAPGTCYRLFSRGALEAMPARPIPEIQRTALEATCLQTCNMTQDRVQDFLSRAMDPPPEESVTFALDRLEELGAIKSDDEMGEILTPLGNLLSRLPLDPATGKMLITGCVMKCLDPVLTAAACFSSRNLFYSPLGMRDEARQIRRSFCGNSDMMATIRAYNTFIDMVQEKGWDETRTWASDNFISIAAVNNISSVRSQLLGELIRIGLVHERDLEPRIKKKKVLRYDASVNENASNESLYAAVWSTALPGNLCARRQLGNFGTLRTRNENHTGLHPSSVAFLRKPPKKEDNSKLPDWFFYHEMVLSSQVFLRNCTPMKPEQIMLFGGNSIKRLSLPGDNANRFILDDWIVVGSRCEDTLEFLSTIRREIDAAISLKVMSPRTPLTESSDDIIDAVSHTFNILDERDEPQYTDNGLPFKNKAWLQEIE